MGILHKSTQLKPRVRRSSPAELKRQIIIEDLRELNVTVSREGVPIEELSYDRLKEEMVLATFRQIDIEADDNEWF